MTTRQEFVDAARTWIDTPWVHQGRNRHGVDCIGLLLVTCWSLNLTDYDVTGYGRSPDADFMRRECARLMTPVVGEPEFGDVLIMRFARDPQHVLIRTDHGVLHSWASARRVVEVAYPAAWRRRIVAAYRVPGVV